MAAGGDHVQLLESLIDKYESSLKCLDEDYDLAKMVEEEQTKSFWGTILGVPIFIGLSIIRDSLKDDKDFADMIAKDITNVVRQRKELNLLLTRVNKAVRNCKLEDEKVLKRYGQELGKFDLPEIGKDNTWKQVIQEILWKCVPESEDLEPLIADLLMSTFQAAKKLFQELTSSYTRCAITIVVIVTLIIIIILIIVKWPTLIQFESNGPGNADEIRRVIQELNDRKEEIGELLAIVKQRLL